MNTYIKIVIQQLTVVEKEILIAQLSDFNFNGFEEGPDFLIAFCKKDDYDEAIIQVLDSSKSKYIIESVEEQNWNQLWEQNFQPVSVNDFCTVRADFHPASSHTRFDIIITPKMSFGTGHHATTYMMIQQLEPMNLGGKNVLDFGTGTGVLAILAKKMGAEEVLGIDNDDWSIENANENILFNDCADIVIQKADHLSLGQQFDLILANINKNVLLSSMAELQQHLKKDGVLILSGLLEGDRSAIELSANSQGLKVIGGLEKEGWISLNLIHG